MREIASVIRAAKKFAASTAGSADSGDYYRLLDQALVNAARTVGDEAGSAGIRTQGVGAHLDLDQGAEPLEAEMSIFDSPVFQENYQRWLADVEKRRRPSLIGGRSTGGQLPECVAVGSSSQFGGSGVLIGPNVVLTAGHNWALGLRKRVYFGVDWNSSTAGETIPVVDGVEAPGFLDHPYYRHDLALLILATPVNIRPAALAQGHQIDQAGSLLLCGFGQPHLGRQMMTELVVASSACSGPNEPQGYGCQPGLELVAGGNGHDSCENDSGGPVYLLPLPQRLLAGITSRRRRSPRMCGDGGIYVRVDRYADWIRSEAAKRGGRVP